MSDTVCNMHWEHVFQNFNVELFILLPDAFLVNTHHHHQIPLVYIQCHTPLQICTSTRPHHLSTVSSTRSKRSIFSLIRIGLNNDPPDVGLELFAPIFASVVKFTGVCFEGGHWPRIKIIIYADLAFFYKEANILHRWSNILRKLYWNKGVCHCCRIIANLSD